MVLPWRSSRLVCGGDKSDATEAAARNSIDERVRIIEMKLYPADLGFARGIEIAILLQLVLNVLASDEGIGFSKFFRWQPGRKGENMKPSTKDQVQGKFHEMKGKVKEKAGKATNNPNLMDEGQAEKVSGVV